MKALKHLFTKRRVQSRHPRLRLLLSIVALLQIVLILIGATYAWVETVSTIRIYTSNSAEAQKPAEKTGAITMHNNQIADVTAKSTPETWIDLSKMIHESGDFHLAPASSADGKNIIFPSANNGASVQFRKATIHDFNVNFVSISFKVKTAASYIFNADPTIQFGNTTVSDNLVRVSFSVGVESAKIFGKSATPNENVVNQTDGSTTATTVHAFSDFTSGKAATSVFTTTAANQIVTMRIWIQDPTFSRSNDYSEKKLNISNLQLIPAQKVTAKLSVNGTVSSNTSIATVRVGEATAGAVSQVYVKYNGSVSFRTDISSEQSDSYVFDRWSTAADGNSVSTDNPYTKSNITTDITYFAIVRQKYTITAQVALKQAAQNITTYGTVQVGSNTAGATSNGEYVIGSPVTLTATPAAGYGIVCWYKDKGNSLEYIQNSNAQTSITVTADSNAKYYVSFNKNQTVHLYFTLTDMEDNMTVDVYGVDTEQHYNGASPGNQPTYDNRLGLYKLDITTTEEEQFRVQINGDEQNTYGDATAVFKNDNCYLLNDGTWSKVSSSDIEDNRFYYFTNNVSGWSDTIKCHSWTASGETTWPGSEMTEIYTNGLGQKVYQIRLSKNISGLIFNNNGNGQTVDITPDTSNTGRYYTDGQENGKWKVANW